MSAEQWDGTLGPAGQAASELFDMVGALDGMEDEDAGVATLVGRIDALIDAGLSDEVLRILEAERSIAAVAKTSVEARLQSRASWGAS